MSAYRTPGPTGALLSSPVGGHCRRDDLQRLAGPTWGLAAKPGPVNEPPQSLAPEQLQSVEVVKSATSAVSGPVAMMTWDSFVRAYVYDPAARVISEQGEEFVRNGTMSHREAASWVNAQRNALLLHVRDNLNTPLGRAFAEFQKPRSALPTLETALEGKRLRSPGASETQLLTAVIQGGGRTRASTNRLAMTFRFAGPALIGVDIVLSGYIIAQAAPEDRGRVAAGQVGGIVGGGAGGWAGAKLGCAGGAAVGVWFKLVGAVPGCAIGGIGGALGLGYAGSRLGNAAGEHLWDVADAWVRWE